MIKAELLVSKIERIKSTGKGKWIACCPSHNDRSPSLSVRELDDGRVLIHCHAGCSPEEVVTSVGLQMSDLMPDDLYTNYHKPIYRKEVQKTVDYWMLQVCKSNRAGGVKLDQKAKEQELQAFIRERRRR
jgi:hypothetical protein